MIQSLEITKDFAEVLAMQIQQEKTTFVLMFLNDAHECPHRSITFCSGVRFHEVKERAAL